MVSGEYQLNASTTKLEYLKSILYSISLATTRESLEEIRKDVWMQALLRNLKNLSPINWENRITFILKSQKANFISDEITSK